MDVEAQVLGRFRWRPQTQHRPCAAIHLHLDEVAPYSGDSHCASQFLVPHQHCCISTPREVRMSCSDIASRNNVLHLAVDGISYSILPMGD